MSIYFYWWSWTSRTPRESRRRPLITINLFKNMLKRINSILSISSNHITLINPFKKLLLGSLQPIPIQSSLYSKLFQYSVHMVSIEIFNIVIERINPFDKLIIFIIEIEYLVYFGLLKINTLLYNMYFIKVFKMYRFDLFDKYWSLLISLLSLYLLIVLILWILL